MAVQPLTGGSDQTARPTGAARVGPADFTRQMRALGGNMDNYAFTQFGDSASRTADQTEALQRTLANNLVYRQGWGGSGPGMSVQAFQDQLRTLGFDPADAQFDLRNTTSDPSARSAAEHQQAARGRAALIAHLGGTINAGNTNMSLTPQQILDFQRRRNANDNRLEDMEAEYNLKYDTFQQDFARQLQEFMYGIQQARPQVDDAMVGRGLFNSGLRRRNLQDFTGRQQADGRWLGGWRGQEDAMNFARRRAEAEMLKWQQQYRDAHTDTAEALTLEEDDLRTFGAAGLGLS